jgi:hypothetical protein
MFKKKVFALLGALKLITENASPNNEGVNMNEFLKELSKLMKKYDVTSISGCYGHGTWIYTKDDECFSTHNFSDNNIFEIDEDGDERDINGFEPNAINKYLEKIQ